MSSEHTHLALSNVGLAFDHPEAVAWGPDGNAYAGGEAGQLYRTTGWTEIPRYNDDPYPDVFFEKAVAAL